MSKLRIGRQNTEGLCSLYFPKPKPSHVRARSPRTQLCAIKYPKRNRQTSKPRPRKWPQSQFTAYAARRVGLDTPQARPHRFGRRLPRGVYDLAQEKGQQPCKNIRSCASPQKFDDTRKDRPNDQFSYSGLPFPHISLTIQVRVGRNGWTTQSPSSNVNPTQGGWISPVDARVTAVQPRKVLWRLYSQPLPRVGSRPPL